MDQFFYHREKQKGGGGGEFWGEIEIMAIGIIIGTTKKEVIHRSRTQEVIRGKKER